MSSNILGKKLLIVIAHPDDESFLAAGLIHANHLAKGETHLICASRGERGYTSEKLSQFQIKRIRERELTTVSKYLGVTKLSLLNMPDGSLSLHTEKLEIIIKKYIQKFIPDYIISFGKDGYTRHNDHIAVGNTTRKVARRTHYPFIEFTKPPHTICSNLHEHLMKKRKNGAYRDMVLVNTIPNIKVKIDPKVKLKALSLHKSQFGGLDFYNIFPRKIADHLINYEYFYTKT